MTKGSEGGQPLGKMCLWRFLEDYDMFMELELEIASLRQQQAAIPPLPPPLLRLTPYVMSQHRATTTTITSCNRWYDWLVGHTPKVKRPSVAHSGRKNKIMSLYERHPPIIPTLVSSAFKRDTDKWKISGAGYKDPLVFLNNIRSAVRGIVDGVVGMKKVYTLLLCEMEREDPKTGVTVTTIMHLKSKTHTHMKYTEIVDTVLENISRFQRKGSGWRLHSIVEYEIFVVKVGKDIRVHFLQDLGEPCYR